jgi:hypothetical protein
MQLLGNANELSLDKRLFDRFAGSGKRGDLEDDLVTQLETHPGNDQLPLDSFHRNVLTDRSYIDRVTFLLEGLNPFQGINANRPLGPAMVHLVILRVPQKP